MTPDRALRRIVAPTLLAAAVAALAACGGPGPSESVSAGQAGPTTEAAPPSSTTAPPATATTDAPAPPTTEAAAVATTAPPSDAGTSPVRGLSPAQLRAAVLAAPSGPAKRSGGATVERIDLPDGPTVWRVRIPGRFPVRAERATVAVGARDVGEGIVTPQLDALVAVTTDPAGLVAGAPVTYRWGQEPSVAAGKLEVAR
jgi:hypothetical protein